MIRAVALLSAVFVASILLAPAGARDKAVRVVDQTYVCGVTAKAGVRKIEIDGRRGFRDGGAWEWFASVGVENWGGPPVKLPANNAGLVATTDLNWRFGVSAGLTEAQPDPPHRPYRAGAWLTPRRACAVSRASVPLSPRRLDGGPADYFGDEYECVTPSKILIRVRAVFEEPATFSIVPSEGDLRTRRASGAVREAHVAVRTTSGRQLAYAFASASGAARVFAGKGCSPK